MKKTRANFFSILLVFLASLGLTACNLVATPESAATATAPRAATASATITPTRTVETSPPASETPTRPQVEPTQTPAPAPNAKATPTPATETRGPFRLVAGLPPELSGDVVSLRAAADGRLWVATTYGYAVWQAGRWQTTPTDLQIQNMLPASDGTVWLAGLRDVFIVGGARWTILTPPDMTMAAPLDPDFFTSYVLEEVGEQVWVGRCDWGGPGPMGGGGARWYDGTSWQGADSPVATGCVTAIRADERGRVWVAANADLWRYDPVTDVWDYFAPPEPPQDYRFGLISDLTFDPAGQLWPLYDACGGASCGQLELRYRLEDGAWVLVREEIIFPQRLVFDDTGVPWLFFLNGVVYRFQIDPSPDTLVADFIVDAVTTDADGRIWAAGGPPMGETSVWLLEPAATLPAATATVRPLYLIYRKNVDGQPVLVGVGQAGRGQSMPALPAGAVVKDLANAVSPDGKWLAFYTGSAEKWFGADQPGGADLALNLMDLSNGQARQLSPLLSTDYPDNFRQAADLLTHGAADRQAQQGVTLAEGLDPAVAPQLLREAFIHGIASLEWSPDGRYLAFAGQMDGLSSDLYVYDADAQTIQRLSDGPEQIQSITWSPDGRWILHGSANVVGEGVEIHCHAAAVDGSGVKTLSSSIMNILGWLTPCVYLQADASNGPAGTYNLHSVNIETGAIETLWSGTFLSYALDPAYDVLAVVGFESVGPPDTRPALFLVDLATGNVSQVTQAAASVEFIGIHRWRFIVRAGNEHLFVQADGTLAETGFDAPIVQVSPELRYVLALGDRLQVYAWGNDLVREIELARPASSIDRLIWRPDSPGIFFTFGSQMYGVDLLDGAPYLVDESMPEPWEPDYIFSAPADIGPQAVWETPQDSEFADCHFTATSALECVAQVMQDSGAFPQAIAFTRLLQGQAFMLSFEEYGAVDVARLMFLPRPNDFFQYVLVNGTPRVVYAAQDLGSIDITQDQNYPALAQQYPGLEIWESLNGFERAEPLPQGGQRFIFRYDLVDGCHICRTGHSAFVAFDFDRTGQFVGTGLLYLK